MTNDQGVWRWNADTVWHYFCSMQYEAFQAKTARNEFMRYHHVRSCIFYAVGVIEALLNQEMRRHLEKQGLAEEKILKRLRSTPLDQKRNAWPSEVCGKPIAFGPQVSAIFETYRDIRNEITHPKRRDHSIYPELDKAEPETLVDAIARAVVTLCEAKGEPFPYWVLGWNYVGMNNDPAHPFQGNNMNGFMWSLNAMGCRVNAGNIHWDGQFMATMKHYELLKETLAKYPADIEPYWPGFPSKPRLTRRWWDHEFIYADQAAARMKAGESDQ